MNMSQNEMGTSRTPYKSKEIQTPNSKHKDKLIVQSNQKRRESNRRSIRRHKIAAIEFPDKPVKMDPRNKPISDTESKNKMQIQNRLNELLQQRAPKSRENILALINKIQALEQAREHNKKAIDYVRNCYYQNKDDIRQLKSAIVTVSTVNYEISKYIENRKFQAKNIAFTMSSQEQKLQSEIHETRAQINQKTRQLQDQINGLTNLTEQEAKKNLWKKQNQKLLKEKIKEKEKVAQDYLTETSQNFILKIQLNPSLFLGFTLKYQIEDKRVLLDKGVCKWDIKKERKVDAEDLKRFVILMLYKGWKKLLRKLSYQASQYQVMFGEKEDEAVKQDLWRSLSQSSMRVSIKKHQKMIVFHSQATQPVDRRQNILDSLQGFNNGLIEIHEVGFEKNQNQVEQLYIKYTYLKTEYIQQRFVFQQHFQLNKERIMKDLKSYEKRIFCVIEIPIVFPVSNKEKYQEIYELVRKRKNK